MQQNPSEKLTGSRLVKTLPEFHRTQRFITAFTSICHLSLSGVRESNPCLPTCTTCPAHLILLDLITRILGKEYRAQNSSLCSLLHSHHLAPLRSKYLPQHPVHQDSQSIFLPQCERPNLTAIQNNRQNSCTVYLDLYIV
jgi:hypothetical protein